MRVNLTPTQLFVGLSIPTLVNRQEHLAGYLSTPKLRTMYGSYGRSNHAVIKLYSQAQKKEGKRVFFFFFKKKRDEQYKNLSLKISIHLIKCN